MKVKALANLSGKIGDRAAGEEFAVGAAEGRELIDRGLVVEVEGSTAAKSTKRAVSKPEPEAE